MGYINNSSILYAGSLREAVFIILYKYSNTIEYVNVHHPRDLIALEV